MCYSVLCCVVCCVVCMRVCQGCCPQLHNGAATYTEVTGEAWRGVYRRPTVICWDTVAHTDGVVGVRWWCVVVVVGVVMI